MLTLLLHITKINRNSVIIFALICSIPISIAAATCTFTNGGGDNLWSNPANWDCGNVPGMGDTAIVNSGTVTVDLDTAVFKLLLSSNINGTGTLTISDSLLWSGGIIQGNVAVSVNGHSNITDNVSLHSSGGLTINGTVNHSNGQMTIRYSSVLTISTGATYNLLGTGQWRSHGAGYISNHGTVNIGGSVNPFIVWSFGLHFTNESDGTFNFNTGSNHTITVTFNNNGIVNYNSGNHLNFTRTLSNTGSFVFSPGDTLSTNTSSCIIDAAIGIPVGVHWNMNGSTSFNTTQIIDGTLDINNTIQGSGSLTLNGNATWSAGIIDGVLPVTSNTQLDIIGGTSLHSSGGLTCNGTVNHSNGQMTIRYSAVLTISTGATYNLSGTGQWRSYGAGYISNHGTVNIGGSVNPFIVWSFGLHFTNESDGTFNFNTGSNHTITVTFNNNGIVNYNSGNHLNFTRTLSNTGSFVFSPGDTLSTNTSSCIIDAAIGIPVGVHWNMNGSTSFNTTQIIDGTLDINNTIQGSGSLTLNGNATWSAGIIDGVLPVTSNTQLDIIGGTSLHSSGGLTCSGTVNHSNGQMTIRYSAVLTISTGATYNLSGTGQWRSYGSGPIISNHGTVNIDREGDIAIYWNQGLVFQNESGGIFKLSNSPGNRVFKIPFINDGLLSGIGSIDFQSAFTNNGTVGPGFSPGIFGLNKFNNTNAILEIELQDNTGPGMGHDQLNITNLGTLGGTLDLNTLNGYVPNIGDNFTIITCGGGCNDTFDILNYPNIPAEWEIHYNPFNVVLSTISGCDFGVTATANLTTICEGETVTLTALPDNQTDPVTYLWTPGNFSGQSIMVSPTTTTVYHVLATDDVGCIATHQVEITVFPLPDPVIVGDNQICSGASTILDAGVFSSYSWNTGAITQTITVSQGGTYSVTVTDNNGCQGEDTFVVSEGDSPTLSLAANSLQICLGDSTDITASANGGMIPYVFSWSHGLPDGTNHTVSPLNTTIYSITVTDATGCTDTDNIEITVTENPTIAINASESDICEGQSATLMTTVMGGTGPYTITWNNGLGSGSSQTVSPLVTTIYSVTVTDNNGCTGTEEYELTVNPAPDVAITGDLNFCAGSSTFLDAGSFSSFTWNTGATTQSIEVSIGGTFMVTVTDDIGCMASDTVTVSSIDNPILTLAANPNEICFGSSSDLSATSTGGTGPYSYVWDNGLGNGAVQNVSPTTSTIYGATVTDVNGCSNSNNIQVIVNENPVVSIMADPNTICAGNSSTILASASGGSGPYTFFWDNGLGSGASHVISPPASLTYSVTATDANGCEAFASFQLVVNSGPIPTITGNNTFCEGGSSILDAGSYASYNWSTGATSQTIEVSTPGNYSVTVTDTNGCTGSDDIDITFFDNPVVSTSATPNEICIGDFSTISASATGGSAPYTYSWDNGLGNGASHVVSPTSTTTYSVTVTDANGCMGSATVSLTVNDLPTAMTLQLNPAQICVGNSTTISATASGGTGPYTFNWDNGLGSGPSHTVSPGATTIYTVTVTDSKGCEDIANVEVTVTENPIPTITGNNTFCDGGSSILDAGFYASYNWSTGATSQTIQVSTPGNYSVTVTDANGCTGSDDIDITVFENPVVSSTATPEEICLGSSSTINASVNGGTPPYNFFWDNGLGSGASHVVSPAATTIYNVTVTDNNGCEGFAQVSVTVLELPGISAIAEPEAICEGAVFYIDRHRIRRY